MSEQPTLASGGFEPADPARADNHSLMTRAQAARFGRVLAQVGCDVREVRAVLEAFGWDLQPELEVVHG